MSTTSAEMVDDSDGPQLTGLERYFGTNTQVRVVEFLARHNDESFQQVTIAEQVGSSQAMVSRIVGPLREAGLVRKTDEGELTLSGTPDAIALADFVDNIDVFSQE